MKSGERNWNKKGQITIFIIIAIMIVALGLLVYFMYPKLKTTLGIGTKDPVGYIQSCIEDDIKEATETVSLQGGSISPKHYILYNDAKVEYLCYTNEYYKLCTVQQAMLKQHIESEIKNKINQKVDSCFNSLKEDYEKRGYNVQLKTGNKKVELLPKRVIATFDYSLTLTKENTEKYTSFNFILNNNLYELAAIAESIVESETLQGDAETTLYMAYYPDLKVEKKIKEDGTKIYILTDRNKGNKFQFASRSNAF